MPTTPSLISPEFERYARLLNALPFSESARRVYEVMSGAVMWDDEQADIPFSEIGWFRMALAYRSSLIVGAPRVELEPIWVALEKAAPQWPGFRSERCAPSEELAHFLAESKRKSSRELELLDSALSGRSKPLSGARKNG